MHGNKNATIFTKSINYKFNKIKTNSYIYNIITFEYIYSLIIISFKKILTSNIK